MEVSFRTLQESTAAQIKIAEMQCNAIINAMREEINSLKKEGGCSTAVESKRISSNKSTAFTPRYLPLSFNEQSEDLHSAHAHQTSNGNLAPFTPTRLPDWPEKLCVTPTRYNQIRQDTRPPPQPCMDLPLEHLHTEEQQSPVLEFSNIVEIVELGGRDIKENNVINRWASLVAGINIPKRGHQWLRAKKQVNQLVLRPCWLVSNQGYISSKTQTGTSSKLRDSVHVPRGAFVGSMMRSKSSWLQPFIVHPDHRVNFLLLVMQGIFICYDVIDFPMAAFRSQTQSAELVLFISVSFWTLDLICSFFRGFHSPDGVIEMRPARIASNYLQHWFVFDILLVVLDWVSLLLLLLDNADRKESKLARATKVRRLSRITRGSRLFRLAKTGERIHAFLDATASAEQIAVVIRIFSLLALILLISHYVACAWYGIAVGNTDQTTWVTVQMLDNLDMFDKYIYALHWALTQFTPCTNNIGPANARERLFASFVALFSLVAFSGFLSSLTTAVMHMKKLGFERYKEEVQIREFLYGKKVPLILAQRVWHFFRKHYRGRTKIVKESDIAFFAFMPKSIHKELLTYLYMPTLATYQVIKHLADAPLGSIGSDLCERVKSWTPVSGQEVFLQGDAATHMFYLEIGSGVYSIAGRSQMVLAPNYISEAVLWLSEWQHPGCLTVSDRRCEMLLLDAQDFITCVERSASEYLMKALRKYASLFAQHLEDMEIESMLRREAHFSTMSTHVEVPSECSEHEEVPSSDLPLDTDVCDYLIVKTFLVEEFRKADVSFITRDDSQFASVLQAVKRRFHFALPRFTTRNFLTRSF